MYIYSIGYKMAFMTSAKELPQSIKFRHGGCIQNGLLLFHPILVDEVEEELHGHEMNGMLMCCNSVHFFSTTAKLDTNNHQENAVLNQYLIFSLVENFTR